jgi:hypothetical protein
MITQDELMHALDYNPGTGIFTWRISVANIKAGRIAGTVSNGYLVIRINKALYYSHRLAFLYMTGKFPENEVDHIDRNKYNNSWKNLRECDSSENKCNKLDSKNTSGVKGVSWSKCNNKWYVQINKNKVGVVKKCFDDIELAELVAEEGRELYHGKFARHR